MNIDVKFLLKFGEQSFMENLLTKGEIYMNTIHWFKDYEKDGIGDMYEGAFEIKNIPNGTLTLQIPDNPIVLNNAKLQLRKYHKDHIGNIYSTYAISNLLLQRKKIHTIDKRMSKFGSHCLIIKDVGKFTNAIFEKLTEMGIEYSHKIVKYKNLKKNNHDLSLFQKSHLLSYQKEHRIIAWTKKNESLKIEIGSIESYSEIYTTDKLIETLKVEIK